MATLAPQCLELAQWAGKLGAVEFSVHPKISGINSSDSSKVHVENGVMSCCSNVFLFLILLYIIVFGRELYLLFYPRPCRHTQCLQPLLLPSHRIDMFAYIVSDALELGVPVWEARNVSSVVPIEARLNITIPPGIRLGETSELQLRVELYRTSSNTVLTVAATDLVRRMTPRARSATMLLEKESNADNMDVYAGLPSPDATGAVPHFLYSRAPLELRLTTDTTPHEHERLPDGTFIGAVDWRKRRYAPHFYVDTFSLLRRHALPLSSNLSRASPSLMLKFKPTSLGRFRLMCSPGIDPNTRPESPPHSLLFGPED